MTQEPRDVPPPPQPPYGSPPPAAGQATSSGLDPKLAGVLAYLFWIVGGILFLAVEKQHPVVRFHAAQSVVVAIAEIVVWVVLTVLGMIPFVAIIAWILWVLVAFGAFILWLFLMYKAYMLERFKLPVLGDYAERLAAKQM